MEPLTKAVGSEFALPANSFTYYRHSFAGWALSKEGEIAYDDEASFTMPDEDTTLYAIWDIESGYLEVTFDAGEGEFTNGQKIEKQIRLKGGAFDVYYFAPTAKFNNKVSIGWALNGQEVYSVILNEAYTFTAIYEEYDEKFTKTYYKLVKELYVNVPRYEESLKWSKFLWIKVLEKNRIDINKLIDKYNESLHDNEFNNCFIKSLHGSEIFFNSGTFNFNSLFKIL